MVVPKPNPTKDKALKLIADKDQLEARISEFGAVLEANDNVGLHGPLLDADGFPRNDIDVYQVRQARQQIICLQNDHKELLKQIEQLMHQLHAEAKQDEVSNKAAGMQLDEVENSSDSGNGASTSTSYDETPLAVIAKVNLVSEGSPAEVSGLRVGDQIIQFGTVNSKNFDNNLNQIGTVVRHMQSQRVALKVLRGQQMLDLILIPKPWSGRGLLGCNIVLPNAMEC